MFLSPGRDLGLDKVFITPRLPPKQRLLSVVLLLVESEALAVETLVVENFVHLRVVDMIALVKEKERGKKKNALSKIHSFIQMYFVLTRRKSLPQAGPMPAAKCFSTPSSPSASLACTVIAFPSAAPHNFATSSAYGVFQRSVSPSVTI